MSDRSQYPSEQADKFLLRFPDGLRDRIKARASENGRSMNAEIIQMLAEVMEDEKRFEESLLEDPDALDDLNSELEIAEIAQRATRTPATVTFAARLFARLEALEESIERKIEALEKSRIEQLERLRQLDDTD